MHFRDFCNDPNANAKCPQMLTETSFPYNLFQKCIKIAETPPPPKYLNRKKDSCYFLVRLKGKGPPTFFAF